MRTGLVSPAMSAGLVAAAAAAQAEEPPLLDLAHLRTCQVTENAEERLACYDEAVKQLFANLRARHQEETADCSIIDLKISERSDMIRMMGTASCREGRLSYRLYEGTSEEFIASGYTFIEGYIFEDWVEAPMPGHISFQYVID